MVSCFAFFDSCCQTFGTAWPALSKQKQFDGPQPEQIKQDEVKSFEFYLFYVHLFLFMSFYFFLFLFISCYFFLFLFISLFWRNNMILNVFFDFQIIQNML
jgi:hypothetical protein